MFSQKYYETVKKLESLVGDGHVRVAKMVSKQEGLLPMVLWTAGDNACARCLSHNGEEFSLDKLPEYPAHPHCLCQLSIIEVDIVRPFAKRMVFDGKRLNVYDQYGNRLYTTNATSGKNGHTAPMYQGEEDTGPIPERQFEIIPEELDNPGLVTDFVRETGFAALWHQGELKFTDWGDWRIRLHEKEDTLGRSGFFLHGGIITGSRGCIEYRGWSDPELEKLIQDSMYVIEVEVDYGADCACTQ